ncbi:MAG TPA: hypothetical protein VGO78_27955 [Acidimicrobiales bacterium]|jgi:hypothetical protein|nr:hypothetical protein [Acidimicrobiales bacterium]
MTLATIDLSPRLGTEIRADAAARPHFTEADVARWRTRPVRSHPLVWTHASGRRSLVHQHEWQVGDLVIWESTGTMHRVVPDAADRVWMMHRTTLVGEEAVA